MSGGEIFFLIVLAFLFLGSGSGGRGGGVVRLDRPTVPRPVDPPKGQGVR